MSNLVIRCSSEGVLTANPLRWALELIRGRAVWLMASGLVCTLEASAQIDYERLKSFGFSGPDGAAPHAPMIEGSDGAFYGTTYRGGTVNVGMVFKVNKDGGSYMALHNFTTNGSDGQLPKAGLVEGSDGALYGTTERGGSVGGGTVFKVNKDGSAYAIVRHFAGSPQAGLIEGSDGALYGTAYYGGALGWGAVFKINKDGSNYGILHHFTGDGRDGQFPRAGLVEGSDGALYGTTYSGGVAFSAGTVFKLNKDGSGYAMLRSFLGSEGDGRWPSGSLVEASDGALYGTTERGGSAGGGTVFKVNKNGNGYAVLREFSYNEGDGYWPAAGLVEGSDGALYGATERGGTAGTGTVFKLNKNGSGYGILHSFHTVSGDGYWPTAGLVEGSDGRLYGTTELGGTANSGTIFKLRANGRSYTILHSFGTAGGDGSRPVGDLAQGTDGALYGTTTSGGSGGRGTVFRLNNDGNGYRVLYNFAASDQDGQFPTSGIIEGGDGALYGTTYYGGTAGYGTVFKLNKKGRGYSVLRSFTSSDSDGKSPYAGLVEGSDGAMYGTTISGGSANRGTVFKLNKDGSGYAVLRSFTGSDGDGQSPSAALVEGRDGALYGTTRQGGSADGGTVFRLSKSGNNYAVLREFTDNSGAGYGPSARLVEASDGVLYGTTSYGGNAGAGTAFKLNKDGSGYMVLISFGSTENDGQYPLAGLVVGSDDALYGTTYNGGSAGRGTIFKLNRNGSGYAALRSFTGSNGDGQFPGTGLVEGSDGALYGTTEQGGDRGFGTVFRFEPAPTLTLEIISRGALLRFAGVPGRTYELHCARALTGPWSIIATNVAPPDNIVEYIDPTPLQPVRFYRARPTP